MGVEHGRFCLFRSRNIGFGGETSKPKTVETDKSWVIQYFNLLLNGQRSSYPVSTLRLVPKAANTSSHHESHLSNL